MHEHMWRFINLTLHPAFKETHAQQINTAKSDPKHDPLEKGWVKSLHTEHRSLNLKYSHQMLPKKERTWFTHSKSQITSLENLVVTYNIKNTTIAKARTYIAEHLFKGTHLYRITHMCVHRRFMYNNSKLEQSESSSISDISQIITETFTT